MPSDEENRDQVVDPVREDGDQASQDATVTDDWAAAFEAVRAETATPAAGDQEDAGREDRHVGEGPREGDEGAGGLSRDATEVDAAVAVGDDGGPLPADGDDGRGGSEETPGDVEEAIERYSNEIEQRAIEETARLFAERADDQGRKLIRQSNGQLGASISDPDIYRVDPDTGVATFYNPDTGRPFTGDNPRAQAKEWVDAYNDELRETFNRIAEQRKAQLEQEMAPVIDLLRFTPTYESLDPVRRQMLDALIEDYEVYDDQGAHIGYSIDLQDALARVNRQIAAIKASRDAQRQAQPAQPAVEKPKTGPAVDMPTLGGQSTTNKTGFKSLAEAMEAQQDAKLRQLKDR